MLARAFGPHVVRFRVTTLREAGKNQMTPKARSERLVIERLPDETLVYDLDRDRAHCLNRTATLVWDSCNGRTTVSQLVVKLRREVGKTANEDMVWLALNHLDRARLLETRLASRDRSSIARREVLRKMGKAAIVSLPVVLSIIAPTAAQAGSCVPTTDCKLRVSGQCCCNNKKCRFSGGKYQCNGAACTP